MDATGLAALVGMALFNAGTFVALMPLVLVGLVLFAPLAIRAFRGLAA
jgi:hypothetical protein